MGFFDRFRRIETPRPPQKPTEIYVGANKDQDEQQIQSFSNSNITFSGALSGYDYDSLLRDKQTNIQSFFQLADYYTDADPIVHGIIKHALVPFSSCSDWFLTGAKEKTYKLYEQTYERMRLREKIENIMLEYWKYGNVYMYLMNGNLITLPINKCRIANVSLNGMPIVDYDCMSTLNEWRAKGYQVKENWIKDNNLETYFKGFPKEITEGLNKGIQYVQLDPENTFVLQGPKEGWQRYAVPFIASCLSALSKKELISKYEDSILNLGIRSFVHVRYGDEKKDTLPDREQLIAVRKLFQQGMSGFPLVTTNHLAKAEVVQPDTQDIFQWPLYTEVNNDILSAGGISGIIVSGLSEDGSTFASAQISMQTAEARINAARDEFCEIMNRINARLPEFIKGSYNMQEPPKFHFVPLDMSGKKALREACTELWEKGIVSTKTMMKVNGYSYEQEKTQRETEQQDGTDETFVNRTMKQQAPAETDGDMGRPTLDDSERKSSPEASDRGSRPKPSRPEGSGDNKQ